MCIRASSSVGVRWRRPGIFHRVPKRQLEQKAFGVYRHRNLNPASPYLMGFSDDFQVSVSRWTEVRREDLTPDFDVLMESDQTGLCLLHEAFGNRLYIFNHIEYDSGTLAEEYFRDVQAGKADRAAEELFPG
jgi:homoserine O-succinyltransferase